MYTLQCEHKTTKYMPKHAMSSINQAPQAAETDPCFFYNVNISVVQFQPRKIPSNKP